MKGTVLKGDGFFLAGDGTMTAHSDNLAAIFTPKSVAVIGASTSPEKLGFQILDLRCFPSIAQVEGTPELAVIIVPAGAVPATLAACGAKGVKGAIVISGGFTASGPDGPS